MKKLLFIVLLCLLSYLGFSQVCNDTTKYFKSVDYGWNYRKIKAREALILPTDTTCNKLGVVSIGNKLYVGDGIKWTLSGGGSGTIPNLQQVLNTGEQAYNKSIFLFDSTNGVSYKGIWLSSNTGYQSNGTEIFISGVFNNTGIAIEGGANTSSAVRPKIRFMNNADDNPIFITVPPVCEGGGLTHNLPPYNTNGMSEDTLATTADVRNGGGTTIDTTSLSNRINLKVNISDTSTMLSNYLHSVDTTNKWIQSITRTAGKDSIIFYKDGFRYAIKDSVGTNPPASGYYGSFQDNTSQTAASINTAYAIKLNTTDLTNGVSVVNDSSSNPTRITLANTGIYNIQFSLQLEKTGGSGNMIADIWIRKNGVDIPSTTGKVVLTGSANASPVIAAWNYVLDLAAGDYVQLMWATTNTNVEIIAAAATSPHPAIPSAILTVTQQAGILAGTGITAINSLTGSAQTITTGTSGTDFAVSSIGTTHTFNLPTASATNRGALSSANWTTFNNKLGASDTVSLSNRINLKLNISDTASMLSNYAKTSAVNLKLNTSDSTIYYSKFRSDTSRSNIYSAINNKVNISDTASMLSPYFRSSNYDFLLTTAYQAMGSTIKSISLACPSITSLTTSLNLASGSLRYNMVYLPKAATITGVKWIQATIGSYTASNYNGVGLYSVNASTGLLTLVASSTNDGTIWQTAASGTMASKAFSATYSASAGLYIIAALYASSAQTTPPSIGAAASNGAGVGAIDFANNLKISSSVNGQSSLPTPTVNISTATIAVTNPVFWLY